MKSDMQFACAAGVPHSPNIKVLGAAGAPAATKEAESHVGICQQWRDGKGNKNMKRKRRVKRSKDQKIKKTEVYRYFFRFFTIADLPEHGQIRLVRLLGPQWSCLPFPALFFFFSFFFFLFPFSFFPCISVFLIIPGGKM